MKIHFTPAGMHLSIVTAVRGAEPAGNRASSRGVLVRVGVQYLHLQHVSVRRQLHHTRVDGEVQPVVVLLLQKRVQRVAKNKHLKRSVF